MNPIENNQAETNYLPKDNLVEISSPDDVIILKPFTLADVKEIFELIDRNRDHLSQNGEDTAEKYPTLESVEKSISNPSNPKRLRFAIRNFEGELVGSINLTPLDSKPKKGEIGYYLGGEFTGKGYASRAVEALTNYGFNNLGYEEIFGMVANTNIPSLNVLKKAGYKETGKQIKENREVIELTRYKIVPGRE